MIDPCFQRICSLSDIVGGHGGGVYVACVCMSLFMVCRRLVSLGKNTSMCDRRNGSDKLDYWAEVVVEEAF